MPLLYPTHLFFALNIYFTLILRADFFGLEPYIDYVIVLYFEFVNKGSTLGNI